MTKLVGILNATPDSFSDGGLYMEPSKALDRVDELFNDGSDLVDIGAESTRPGATPLSDEEEWARLEHILPHILGAYPGRIMLDSYHAQTIRKAASIGEIIVNDITGLTNPAVVEAVLSLRPKAVVISQLPASNPEDAHRQPQIHDVGRVLDDLLFKADILLDAGYDRKRIILDPGIGFGKTPETNYELLSFPRLVPDFKTMIGYSRKRFLGEDRHSLETNIEAAKIAIAAGATYLRVHDVAGHREQLGELVE